MSNSFCPICKTQTDCATTDSRPSGTTIRRRRKCYRCESKFTTYEITVSDKMTYAERVQLRDVLKSDDQAILAAVLSVWYEIIPLLEKLKTLMPKNSS